jgi:radical SAM protein with 4Fe4S-binding SPASM domain
VRKIWNFCRIGFSYLLSRTFRRTVHWGKPVSVSLEPVNRCNLRCPECPAGKNELTRPQGTLSPDLFRSILGQLAPELAYLTLYFQGEPYLHPGFTEMVRHAKSLNVYVASSTNGHFIDNETARATVRSGLDKLIVSVDGADQETYAAYRTGGSLERVVDGLRHLSEAKTMLASRKPETVVQCLLLRTNQHQKGAIRKLAKDVKADRVEFKTAQFHDFENGNPLMPEEERDSRYKKVNESTSQQVTLSHCHSVTLSPKYKIKNPLRNHCFRMWSSCVITWDGLVVPCCFDKDAGHVMGDLKVQRFDEIWNGEKYREFRKNILQDRKSIDICRNCTQKI